MLVGSVTIMMIKKINIWRNEYERYQYIQNFRHTKSA